VLLPLDGHRSHTKSLQLMNNASKNGVILLLFHTTLYTQALHRPASHTAPNEEPSTSKDSKGNEVSCCRPTTEEHLDVNFSFSNSLRNHSNPKHWARQEKSVMKKV